MTHELTDRLHAAILNLPWDVNLASQRFANFEDAYASGHGDARHAAAELVLAHLAQRGTSETKDGIRILPAQAARVETGPVQFGDDWPGVFIRGDNAYYYAGLVRAVIEGHADVLTLACLQGLHAALAGSDLTGVSGRPLAASPQAQSMPEGGKGLGE